MSFVVRAAIEDDAESIAQLLNPIIQAGKYTAMDSPLSVEDQAEFIRNFPTPGVFNIAVWETPRRVVGIQDLRRAHPTVNAFKHVGDIGTFVAMDMHRSGIGTGLLNETVKQAKEQGFRKINAMIRADNPLGLSFYQGHGFKIIGTARKHAFLGGRYIDEILTELLLD